MCQSKVILFFLPRDAICKRGTSRRPVRVRPSICLSITFVYFIETAKDVIELFFWDPLVASGTVALGNYT